MVGRGVLLDVAKYKGQDPLPADYWITLEDLQNTAKAQKVEIQKGDILLVRTGWLTWYRSLDEAGRTVARDRRSALYRQIQEIVVQDLPYFWLVETPTTRAWAARCGGFRPWTGLFAEAASCKP